MFRTMFCFPVVLVAFCMALPTLAQGPYLYQFEQEGTGEVLATLELASLPATQLSDLLSFRFTDAGDAVFAIGTNDFGPEFDFFGSSASGDGAGGLVGPAFISLDEPPIPSDLTNYPEFLLSNTLQIRIGAPGSFDLLEYRYDDSNFQIRILSVDGNWIQVPEPSALALFCVGAIVTLRRRRF